MGWLDKVFSKKEEERAEDMKISLAGVEDFLRNKIEKDFEPLKDPIKKEHENLRLIANNMQDQLKTLEEATYPERTYPFIIRKAVGSRKSFVDKMNFLIEHIQKPIGEDMNSMVSFHDETDKLISTINLETVKDYASVKILFEKEGREVVQSFFQVVDIDKKLDNMLKDFKESNSKLLKAKEIVAEISRLTEDLRKDESSELERTLKETETKIKKIQEELEKLSKSGEWERLLEMQGKREEMKQGMQNKKSEFIHCLSQLEIPLKKYNWSAKNKVLDFYLQKSFDLILSEDPRGDIIRSALRDIKMKILEEELELKDSDRFLDIISKTIEDNTMGKMINDYLKLSEELKKQEEKIASQEIIKRKNNLESEMEKLGKEVEELRSEKEIAEKRTKSMQEDREQKLKELQDILSGFSNKRILLQAD